MSIDSRILVTDPMPLPQIRELFETGRQAVAAVAGVTAADLRWRHGDSTPWPGNDEFQIVPQGLPVRLRVAYGVDGPLLVDDTEDGRPAGFVEISLDSSGDVGADRPRLHAVLLQSLGTWLSFYDLDWQWRYEDWDWATGLTGLDQIEREPSS